MKVFCLYDDNICPFSRELNVFNMQICKISFKSWALQSMCILFLWGDARRRTTHTSVKLVKLTPLKGEPCLGNFARKPKISLTLLLG